MLLHNLPRRFSRALSFSARASGVAARDLDMADINVSQLLMLLQGV